MSRNRINDIDPLKFIKHLLFIELVFYLYLTYDRFLIVDTVLGIDKGIRQLIDLFRREDGWNFIFLSMLLISFLLTFYRKRIAWILKIAGLLCVSFTLASEHSWLTILTVLLLAFYFRKRTMVLFDIEKEQRVRVVTIVVFSTLVLLISSILIDIIKY